MGGNEGSNVEKFSLADPPHQHHVLDATERPVLGTMGNDSFSDSPPYAGQRFQLIGRGGVDVDPANLNCRGVGC